MFSRALRAETRSKAKEELKRVKTTIERVRKWEKKWITVKDTTMKLYKWVPSANQTSTSPTTKKGMFARGAPQVKKSPRPYEIPEQNQYPLGLDQSSNDATGQSQISSHLENFKKGVNGTPQTGNSSIVDSESFVNEDSNLSFPNPESNACSIPAEDDDTKSGSELMSTITQDESRDAEVKISQSS